MRDLMQIFFNIVGIFFVLYMIGYSSFLFMAVLVGTTTLHGAKRRNILKNELIEDYFLPVSVLVPAYNEEATIVATIHSLLLQNYKLYEIIVIDDGSKDETSASVLKAYSMVRTDRPIQRLLHTHRVESVYEGKIGNVPITLIRKENGGKADALNVGINAGRYPYFLSIDADSVLQYDSLSKIVRPVLEDDNVVAVGGAVRPCNGTEIKEGKVVHYGLPNKLLSCMQVLEYDRSFLAARILFDQFNGSIIISGAFGLFKKSIVVSAGGYDADTMGEDMELVVKMHVFCRENKIPYRIRYASDAICWTQVPEKFSDLCKQRRRWHIGLFQSMLSHRTILGNLDYGLVGFVSYVYFLIYELFSPYIEVFGVLTMILAVLLDFLNVPFMLLYMAIYVVFSSVLSLAAFFARLHTIDQKLLFTDVLKAIGLCAAEVSFLRFALAWVRMTALIGYHKKKTDWGEIERQYINFS